MKIDFFHGVIEFICAIIIIHFLISIAEEYESLAEFQIIQMFSVFLIANGLLKISLYFRYLLKEKKDENNKTTVTFGVKVDVINKSETEK